MGAAPTPCLSAITSDGHGGQHLAFIASFLKDLLVCLTDDEGFVAFLLLSLQ